MVRARRIILYILHLIHSSPRLITYHLPIPITYTMPVQKRNEKGMTGYNAMWDKQSAKDNADHVKSRVDNYTDLVNGMSYPHASIERPLIIRLL